MVDGEEKGNEQMPKKKSVRLVSLDIFRGLTIAGMILVNNPGSWSYVYKRLGHASWHGRTPTLQLRCAAPDL